MSYSVQASEVSLGLWSHHFDRSSKPNECVNEDHNLLSYSSHNVVVGGYKNSHCKQSFFVGYQQNLYGEFGYTVSLVSGYPKSMYVVDKYVVVPMMHYTFLSDNVGVKVYFIPGVLVAAGYVIRF
jgi:hypothetical protein